MLAGIIASAMDAIISVDESQRVVLFNAAAERIFKCPASQAIGGSLDRFIPERFRQVHRGHITAFGQTGVTSRSMWRPGTLVGVRTDGEEFPIEATISQVMVEGRRFFAVILRDVTERVRSETALRETEAKLGGIIGSAMDAIISVNEAHEIVVFNAAAERIFDCPASEAIGTPIHRFLPERFRSVHERHIREFGATGVTTRSMGALRPLIAVRVDGSEFPIEAAISQVEVGGQRLFTVILRDISERKRAEAEREQLLREAKEQALILERANAELVRLAAEAEAANKAKSDFLAVMSHELRTPLNAIAGYTEILEMGVRGPVTAEQAADLQRIRRSQTHLLGLINEVLNFARLETGHVEYDLEPLVIDDVVSSLHPLIAPQLLTRALRYEYVSPRSDLAVRGDHEKVQQILLNLLSNAIKFTPVAGLISMRCEANGNWVYLHVHDTGRGIPPDQLDNIFEPFVQVDRRLTREHGGVGLGLAISRDLARGMSGDLTASSTVGQGSTFTLKLPRA